MNASFVREELADLFPATPPRRPPNYFFTGKGHPPDPRRPDYMDLEREP